MHLACALVLNSQRCSFVLVPAESWCIMQLVQDAPGQNCDSGNSS